MTTFLRVSSPLMLTAWLSSSDIHHWSAAQVSVPSKELVHRRYLQAVQTTTPPSPTLDHQCVREIRRPRQTSSAVIRPYVGRKKNHYCKVFNPLLEILASAPDAKQITLDFERAVWAALRKVMPQVKLQGCVFHWTQALWRKVWWNFIKIDNNIRFNLTRFTIK